jgi:hypothetical protein
MLAYRQLDVVVADPAASAQELELFLGAPLAKLGAERDVKDVRERSRVIARARAFAMHAIAQTEADALRHAQMRYSLWTGDPGFAIYLWDCLNGRADFPTLDVFYVET